MPRGRHRQSSALLRISVLAGALAPALIALLLMAIGGSTAVLRVGVLCAVVSTACVVVLLRQSRRGYGKDLAVRSGERESLAQSADEARAGREETLLKLAARERELATARERERGMLNRIANLEKALPPRPVRLSAPLFAQGAAALANLERAAAERNRGNLYEPEAPGIGVGAAMANGSPGTGGGVARKAPGAPSAAGVRGTGVVPRAGTGLMPQAGARASEGAQSVPGAGAGAGAGAAAAAASTARAGGAGTDVARPAALSGRSGNTAGPAGSLAAPESVARTGTSAVDRTPVRRPSATPWAIASGVPAVGTRGAVPAVGSSGGVTAGAGSESQAARGAETTGSPTTGSPTRGAVAGRPNTNADRTADSTAAPSASPGVPVPDAATARVTQVPSSAGGQVAAASAATAVQAAPANNAAASPYSLADGQLPRLDAPQPASGDATATTPPPADRAKPNTQPGDAAAVESAASQVPGVRRPPIAVSGLVPAYAASVFGPVQGTAPAQAVAAPTAPTAPTAPAAAVAPPARTAGEATASAPAESVADSGAVAERRGSDSAASVIPGPARRHAAPEASSAAPPPSAPAAVERRTPRHAAPAAVAPPGTARVPEPRPKADAASDGAVDASLPAAAEPIAGPSAATATSPALDPAAELVLRPTAAVEAFVPTAEPAEAGPVLDLGVESLEPAVAALPADEAVARVVRDVADTVRETNRRMAEAETAAGRFDFFGRPVAEEPAAEAAVPETEAEAEAGPQAPVPPRAARAPRELIAGRAAAIRPLLTHEPRTGRALPVDLTAHDDTEQLPKIVDDRKQA
ncbi:hypothetical protein ACPA54_07435 [Uniformispora flossi]|uniref:hypothetical protein n=1 Tax=Uniformispora flossi TaxID=3390723 RepID=UPI003C2CB267